jgi:hypothetical protein
MGPVNLEVAVRFAPDRNLVAAWKALLDSLVAILGRAPGKSEFDIEDGRITSLAIHQELVADIGHRIEVRLWWRTAGPVLDGGPPLSYEVLDGGGSSGLHRRPTTPTATGPEGARARRSRPRPGA